MTQLFVECSLCDGTSWQDGCAHGPHSLVSHVVDCGSKKVWRCPPFVGASDDEVLAYAATLPGAEKRERQAYEDGESSGYADWTFALAEIAGLPEEVAALGPSAFARWLNEHWPAAVRPLPDKETTDDQ